MLLVFFPLAFTGICQGELDYVRDHLPEFDNDDTATLAISVGPPPTHKVWATQSGFGFPVLSDFWPHGAVAQAYGGVFNADAGFANRGDLRDRPRRCHPVRRVQGARRGARSIGLDAGAGGRVTSPPGHGRVAQW